MTQGINVGACAFQRDRLAVRSMGFDHLGDILNKIRKKPPGFSKRRAEAEAMSRWETAVGPMIAKHAQATKVVRGELWVEVDHPIWRSELHHKKRQILETLNRQIG